ncbi:MAG TPA: hypothetical protein VF847_02960 [Candidatus Deferrimicrobiaceae bacterium]
MDRKRLHERRVTLAGYGPVIALPALLLAFSLLVFLPADAATDNAKAGTFEERAAAERMSRSRYRNLEVASLVVILAAGGGAIYWAISRRKR